MSITTLVASDTPWSLWKRHFPDHLGTAAVAALLEAGAFLLFFYMFVQSPQRVIVVVGAAFALCCTFHVVISALNAYLLSHPQKAPDLVDAPPPA